MSVILAMLSQAFMWRALIVGTSVSLVAALVGVTLVLRRDSMLGDGLSHAAFGAFAVATIMGLAPLVFAIPVVVAVSFLLLHFGKNSRISSDALVAVLSASSLAFGTLLISVVPGVNIDLNSYLFGSILAVNGLDVYLSLGLTLLTLILYVVAHHRIFAITFDEDFARAIGIKTRVYDAIFALICSVVVVLGMRLLGALLTSSLLIFPALAAMQLGRSFRQTVIWAAAIAVINFWLGLTASYLLALPTGASVVLVNLLVLIIIKIIGYFAS